MFNKLVAWSVPYLPKRLVWSVGKRYIAGLKLEDAINCTLNFEKLGGKTTIDVLGEFVSQKERALEEVESSLFVLDSINANGLKSYLSIKPTSQGLAIDFEFGYQNIKRIVQKANDLDIRVRIDMENSPYTQLTLDLYKRLVVDDGFNNVGIVLQSYLKRTLDDIKSLLPYRPNIRLCKGIYVESPDIAYRDKEEVRENYKKCLDLIVENIPNGAYPAIATHDEPLIMYAEEVLKKHNINKEDYSFEMLLGVRENRRNKLLEDGHHLTIYVPFGEDWYGYSTRRIKENPQMAGHIVKAFFGIGQ